MKLNETRGCHKFGGKIFKGKIMDNIMVKTKMFRNDDEFGKFQEENPTINIHVIVPIPITTNSVGIQAIDGRETNMAATCEYQIFITYSIKKEI
jgi:hypothetical protein